MNFRLLKAATSPVDRRNHWAVATFLFESAMPVQLDSNRVIRLDGVDNARLLGQLQALVRTRLARTDQPGMGSRWARLQRVRETLDVSDRGPIHVGECLPEEHIASVARAVDRPAVRVHAGRHEHLVVLQSLVPQRI